MGRGNSRDSVPSSARQRGDRCGYCCRRRRLLPYRRRLCLCRRRRRGRRPCDPCGGDLQPRGSSGHARPGGINQSGPTKP
jgi:hypothetical protein